MESFELGEIEKIQRKKQVPSIVKITSQLKLLLWKRRVEIFNQKWELVKYLAPPGLFFILMILLYAVFDLFYDGGIEDYIVPLAFWVFIQKNVVNIMFEKSTRLQESMRMMGLSDTAYWVSYFISDGIVLGFLVTLFCCILSTYGLFNQANFGAIFALLFLFCIASAPFGFFLCSFFDTPQTAGQATLGILLGIIYILFDSFFFLSLTYFHNFFYILYNYLGLYVIYIALELSTASVELQTFFSLIPPLALQIGCATFRGSYEGLSLGSICGLLVFFSIFLKLFLFSIFFF